MKSHLAVSAIFFFAIATPPADLVLRGSDTLGAKMIPQLLDVYRKLHPEMKFEVAAQGTTGCFTNLLAGTCDLGMASRPVSEAEKKRNLFLYPAGPANPEARELINWIKTSPHARKIVETVGFIAYSAR